MSLLTDEQQKTIEELSRAMLPKLGEETRKAVLNALAMYVSVFHDGIVPVYDALLAVEPAMRRYYPNVPWSAISALTRIIWDMTPPQSVALQTPSQSKWSDEMPRKKIIAENEDKRESAFAEITVTTVKPHPTGEKGASLEIPIPKSVREMTGISRDTPVYLKVDTKKRIILEKVPASEVAKMQALSTEKRK